MKLRLTVTKEWEPDPASYTDVEFPVGSGEHKDLTDPAEMAAYEQARLDEGEIAPEDIFGDDVENVVKVEVVQEAQVMEQPLQTGNPFRDEPQVDEQARREEAAAEAEEASGATAEESTYQGRHEGESQSF